LLGGTEKASISEGLGVEQPWVVECWMVSVAAGQLGGAEDALGTTWPHLAAAKLRAYGNVLMGPRGFVYLCVFCCRGFSGGASLRSRRLNVDGATT
jgi:hypothetical protein